MSKYKKYDKRILELHELGYRNRDISKELSLDSRRVSDRLKVHGLKGNTERAFELTDREMSIMVGSAMGDGSLFRSTKGSNYRFGLAHSLKQKEYFLFKYHELERIVRSEWKVNHVFDKRTEKTYSEIRLQSRVNPVFNQLHKEWYGECGEKEIKRRNIDKITPLALAVKYFDDGFFVRGGGAIAMSSFSEDSVGNLRTAMLNMGIETTVWTDKTIYIPKNQFIKFKELIQPYATTDVLYKLGEFRETPNT